MRNKKESPSFRMERVNETHEIEIIPVPRLPDNGDLPKSVCAFSDLTISDSTHTLKRGASVS